MVSDLPEHEDRVSQARWSINASPTNRTRLLAVIATVALTALVSLACGDGSPGSDAQNGLPTTDLALLDGGVVNIGEPGQARVLNLWATWCTPCRAELPVFDAAARAMPEGGPRIIGVNTGDRDGDARELVEELGLSFDQLLDPDASLQTGLQIMGLPATVFLDDAANVLAIRSGEVDAAELDELLATYYPSLASP